MKWEQFVIAAILVWLFVATVLSIARDRKFSSGWVTLGVFIQVAIFGGLVLVLHSGGFW